MSLRTTAILLICTLFYLNIYGQELRRGFNELIDQKVFLVVLGTVQDAGSPHIACKKECCLKLFEERNYNRKVVSLGLVDQINFSKYIFEATPDLPTQMKALKEIGLVDNNETPDGFFLTHAHIGHYSGLMYLGKEAMNADELSVFAMPKMIDFLQSNGPWDQLVRNRNINLSSLAHDVEFQLTPDLNVRPLLVPHRDEYSETVGFIIKGPNKTALFLPDIDKWEKWEVDINELIKEVDYAFIDATFYDGKEINNRDISEIPHPFIIESMEKFRWLPSEEKSKILFIHFNHTNPVLDENSEATQTVLKKGFNIARKNDVFEL
ncbi:MBL fold metallo-hydrolase [Lutimonas sp.]|uniref:MBL fold metallo-hydrolase n=1 Tax=Lutimonas sp. TaxID=1872403 RepID=UPI003D9BB47A